MRVSHLFLLLSFLIPTVLWSQSEKSERVIFSSYRPQGWDIYLSDISTDKYTQITFHEALDYNPVMSPDGKWIVFTSERQGDPGLYIKSVAEGGSPRSLIKGDHSMQDQAAISSDQKWLIFTSTHEGNSDIYRLPFLPDSTINVRSAKNLTQHKGGDFRPSFSPDGNTILFSSDRSHAIKAHPRFVFSMVRTADIYRMNIEGENLKRVTQNANWEGSPNFSASGDLIYFYGEEEGFYRIYSVTQDGANKTALSPKNINAVSPVTLNDSTLIFTTWEAREFRLMRLNLHSNEITPLFDAEHNFHGAKTGHNGILVFYGGPTPEDQSVNMGGFSGDILVKGAPFVKSIGDQNFKLFGIRRAFAAPPVPVESTVIFNHSDVNSLTDAITNWVFVPALLLVLYLLLLIWGNNRIRKLGNRMSANVFFSALVLIQVGLLSWILYYFYILERVSINTMRIYLGGVALLFLLGIGFTRIRKSSPGYEPVRNSLIFSVVSSLILALILPRVIQIPVQFYKSNYLTKEANQIHAFIKPSNYNPFNGRVIDTKLSPSGNELIYTVGSFRGEPKDQGDVFSLNLKTYQSTRISDSDFNDGFGDISMDNSKFVFRSGRTGDFDIFLKEGTYIQNLTKDRHRDNFPVISPQGDKIAFCSDREGMDIEGKVKTMDIFLFQLNENEEWEGPVRLTDDPGQDAHPHFSPDGEWIIYSSEEGGINDEEPLVKPVNFGPQIYGEIFAIHLKTRNKIRLTHNKWEDGAPLWTKGH